MAIEVKTKQMRNDKVQEKQNFATKNCANKESEILRNDKVLELKCTDKNIKANWTNIQHNKWIESETIMNRIWIDEREYKENCISLRGYIG